MDYRVGIDVGTTFTAAAIHRSGSAEIFPLSERRIVAPTMVARDEDGRLLAGWPAARQLREHPERVVHSFKRRIGDRTPIPLGDREYEPSWYMAQIMSAVVTEITRVQGEPPNRIALTHPANWNARKITGLLRAASTAGLTADAIILMSEPEAAAVAHAATTDVAEGSMLAVYDLGGGSFDTGVLRRSSDDYEIVGLPEGVDRLGGLDFDATLYRYAIDQLRRSFPPLDPSDDATARGLSQLHLDCVVAKEALSFEQHAVLSLELYGRSASVTIGRPSFEALVRPALMETISALRRCLASARIRADNLDEVLLTGGSSQIPLVTELLSAELGRPVSVHSTPKELVALGAAFAAARADGADGPDPTPSQTASTFPVAGDHATFTSPGGGPSVNGNGRAAEVGVPGLQAPQLEVAAHTADPNLPGANELTGRPAVPRVELDAATATDGHGPRSSIDPDRAQRSVGLERLPDDRFGPMTHPAAPSHAPSDSPWSPSSLGGDRLSLIIGIIGAVTAIVMIVVIVGLLSS